MGAHPGRQDDPRILVIEDEAALRELVIQIMQRLGYAADTVGDGRGAIDLIGQHDYAVILCDLRMPGMDGPSFYRELQRTRPDLASRVVFMSAHANLDEFIPFIKDVRTPVLSKPFNMDEFRDTLARMLGPRAATPQAGGRSATGGGQWLVRCSCGWARAESSEHDADSSSKLHRTMSRADVQHVTRIEAPIDPKGRTPPGI